MDDILDMRVYHDMACSYCFEVALRLSGEVIMKIDLRLFRRIRIYGELKIYRLATRLGGITLESKKRRIGDSIKKLYERSGYEKYHTSTNPK